MTTDSPPANVRCSDGLGAGAEARCYVHVHAPQPDAFGIRRHHCPTCKRRTFLVWRHTPWYGSDETCLRCGEEWQDGNRAERPFAPRWRERNKAAARKLYRRLVAGTPAVVEPDVQAQIDELARELKAPNAEVRR